jgi:hypothetical protein
MPDAQTPSPEAEPLPVPQPVADSEAVSPADSEATPSSVVAEVDGDSDESGAIEPEGRSAAVPEPGSLEDFAERARRARLPVEDETHAANLLKGVLLGGRAEVARAIGVISVLPWIITVQGTAAAWPEMKPSFRSQLLAGLARSQNEGAPRVRLSLARGLYKVDAAASLKLILLTLKVLRDKETGLLSGKGAPLFANVLIGRGKAWVLQLPTAELKPAELEVLVHSALHGAFHAPQAPITQLSILRWAGALEKLTGLPPALDQMISRSLSRWSAKWQNALRKEVTNFPEAWLEILKPAPEIQTSEPERGEVPAPSQARDEDRPPQERTEPVDDEDSDDEEDEEDEDESEAGSDDNRPARPQRPVYVSKTVPPQNQHQPRDNGYGKEPQPTRRGMPAQQFNLQETLRQIEQYTNGLRNELQIAQKQLRNREDDSRRPRKIERSAGPIIPGEPTVDELARLNLQLEARNSELAARIEELTVDSEDRAASKGLVIDAPAPDSDTQLRALLAFKLKEDFDDFKALEEAAKDLVVQQHYRSVLQHVFEILQLEGVRFPEPEPSA